MYILHILLATKNVALNKRALEGALSHLFSFSFPFYKYINVSAPSVAGPKTSQRKIRNKAKAIYHTQRETVKPFSCFLQ